MGEDRSSLYERKALRPPSNLPSCVASPCRTIIIFNKFHSRRDSQRHPCSISGVYLPYISFIYRYLREYQVRSEVWCTLSHLFGLILSTFDFFYPCESASSSIHSTFSRSVFMPLTLAIFWRLLMIMGRRRGRF